MTQITANQRQLPALSRSFVRGFLGGVAVVMIAALGILLALMQTSATLPEADWPSTLLVGDCRSSGSIVTAFKLETDRAAANVADGYAHAWSASGWDVVTRVSGQYAILTATRPAMTYSLELFQHGQLMQAVGNGQQQCAP